MHTPPIPRTALQAVKNFRTRELRGVISHLSIFGPFPEASESAAGAGTKLANPFLPKRNPRSGKWRPPKYSMRRQADLVKKAHATGTLHLLPPGPKKAAFEFRMQRVQDSLPKAPSTKLAVEAKNAFQKSGKTMDELVAEIETKAKELKIQTAEPSTSTPSALPVLVEEWATPIQWVGKAVEKKVPGAELGIRLYAGKKRMFKGHLWERVRAKRTRRHTILMRDMAARVSNYKNYYKKRRPNPLKPSRLSKAPKLPF
ncbi:hypothetical protein B0H34DRAFT_513340 [Crassisporium funariophilum]|nr:hypothetical protein B0H34DRAFT_513340 [Crassisporium funariophilum]